MFGLSAGQRWPSLLSPPRNESSRRSLLTQLVLDTSSVSRTVLFDEDRETSKYPLEVHRQEQKYTENTTQIV